MLSKEQLQKLSTKRLLAYKRKHFSHRWITNHGSDCFCGKCVDEKQDKNQYNQMYEFIKELLNQREHI